MDTYVHVYMTEFEVFLLYYCINNNESSFDYFDFVFGFDLLEPLHA